MIIAITGATSGIGFETAKALLEKGHELIMLVRNPEKAENKLLELPNRNKVSIINCDLADLESVVVASKELLSKHPKLDVLINNAGGTFKERMESKDGYELHLAINHLGHFLLVNKMFDYLLQNKTKIINVSSEAHRAGHLSFEDLNLKQKYSTIKAYGNAKLCNILFSKSLTDKGLTSYALHPGVINTGFGDNLNPILKAFWFLGKPLMKSPREGASTTIFLAINKLEDSKNGKYFKDRKTFPCSKEASDPAVRERLWQESEAMVKAFL